MANDLEIRPLPPFGAEIDTDLDREWTSAQGDELRSAFDKYHLLVFRNQRLSYERQFEFSALFGPPIAPEKGYRMISNVAPGGGLGQAELLLHSDGAFLPEPFLAISLHALEVDNGNTSTFFQDNMRAYEQLPADMKSKLASLLVRHVWAVKSNERNSFDPELPYSEHRLIIHHPRTGKPILYLSALHAAELVGVPAEDSEALILDLIDRAREDNIYEHKWHVGDLVIWDNRACSHGRGRVSDVPRTLQRVVLGTMTSADLSGFSGAWTKHFAQVQEYAAQ